MKKIVVFLFLIALLFPGLVFGTGAGEKEEKGKPGEEAIVPEGGVTKLAGEYEYVSPTSGKKGTVRIESFKEAPALSEKVKLGELPPLEERLPKDVLVLEPIEEIGKYGGNAVAARTLGYRTYFTTQLQQEFLVNYTTPNFGKIIPNVARDWKVSKDGKVYTIYLREGMKWSDGYPFTADDLVFWYEDVQLNEDLYPGRDGVLKRGTSDMTVKKIDDYTVEYSFTEMNPFYLDSCAFWRPPQYAPRHYLEQFLPKYNSEAAIEKMMKDEDFTEWKDLFFAKFTVYDNPDIPVVSAWKCVNKSSDQVQIFERNPYYWKVDTKGNQLPYINRWESVYVSDTQGWLLKTIAGELDWAPFASFGTIDDIPLLKKNEEKGDYKSVIYTWLDNNIGTVFFNYRHKDPVIRNLFLDKRFRIALSIALNREEIINVLFDGATEPSQPISSPGSYQGDSPLFKKYTEYDPEEANRLLDEMGLTNRDSKGYRLRPDGKELFLVNINEVGWPTETPEMVEMYKKYWDAIGIQTVGKTLGYKIVWEMKQAGNFDLFTHAILMGGRPFNIYTIGYLFPSHDRWTVNSDWGKWLLTDGKEGVEPPAYVKRLRELYILGMREVSEEKRTDYVMEAFRTFVDNLPVIGVLVQPPLTRQWFVKNRMANLHSKGKPLMCGAIAATQPSAWFIKY